MIQLSNKKILLCITGGIAAYKTPELTRIFKKNKADVRIIMTQSAKEFVASLSLQAVSGNQIHYSLLDEEAELGMSHIELAKWADVILIAPCTAESIAWLAQGRALLTFWASVSLQVMLLPAYLPPSKCLARSQGLFIL